MCAKNVLILFQEFQQKRFGGNKIMDLQYLGLRPSNNYKFYVFFLSSSCCYTKLLVVYVTCNLDRCGKNENLTEKKKKIFLK